MRIISGKYKRLQIQAPKNIPSRPTTDMAKSGLFNILHNAWNFEYKKVLDLFSGTGNIAYEFASRGCTPITAIEQNSKCVKFIKSFAQQHQMPISILQADVFKYLSTCTEQFNIVFADPPYALIQEIKTLPDLVFDNDIIKDEGWLIIETDDRSNFDDHPKLLEQRSYGGSIFWIFE